MKYKSNNNVTYSCKYHVVFCPKYRRPVLVDGVVDAFSNDNVMGVDLGIKCPAVSYCPDGSVKFYGNGRKNKYIRRHYNNLRKRFQKAKKPKAVVKINNKEQRIMKDIDHKLSHEIVNTHPIRNELVSHQYWQATRIPCL